ncbi:MAG: hypothetical protein ACRC50_06255 [Gaiella sp.]
MIAEHRRLCTIELVAEGHAERCPGEACAFWHEGCVLEAAEDELAERPEVAALLLDLRRAVESGAAVPVTDARTRLARALGGISDESGPGGGATELV